MQSRLGRLRVVVLVFALSPHVCAATQPPGSMAEIGKAVAKSLPLYYERYDTIEAVQCDSQPSVTVGHLKGYRVLVRLARRECVNCAQQQQVQPRSKGSQRLEEARQREVYITKASHVDLVLFPAEQLVPRDTRARIPWKTVEQEYYAKPVCMGQGWGYTWFARTTIPWQEQIRERLGLTGGDDRLSLLAEGLAVKDGPCCATAFACAIFLPKAGDAAVPYILHAISTHRQSVTPEMFEALGRIHTGKATAALRRLYADEQFRNGAASGLVIQPYRKAAKSEYLDMLRRQEWVEQAAAACVQFRWREAMPVLREVCAKPKYWD